MEDYSNDWFHNMRDEEQIEGINEDGGGTGEIMDETSGCYHCKSALRDHESNMKLSLYRRDFNKLKNKTNSSPYTDEYLTLLSLLWNCLFLKREDLFGKASRSAVDHAEPCPKFKKFSHGMTKDMKLNKEMVHGIIRDEMMALRWGSLDLDRIRDFLSDLFDNKRGWMEALLYLNCAVVCLNHKNDSSIYEDATMFNRCGFIKYNLEEGYFKLFYNSLLSVEVLGTAVRVKAGGYDQILQKDLFLNLVDKIQERVNIYVFSGIEDMTDDQDVSDSYVDRFNSKSWRQITEKIIKLGDDLVRRWKNKAFSFIGKYEAYCVATITSHDDDSLWYSDEFMNNLVREDEESLHPDMMIQIREFLGFLKSLNIRQLGEIHGLWRIWGHPIIELEKGLKKMEDLASKVHIIDKKETKISERTFKFIYFKNYYEKHGFYPLCNASREEDIKLYSRFINDEDYTIWKKGSEGLDNKEYITRCIRNNMPISPDSSLYNHKKWDKIEIIQHFKISSSMNLATMIKDKAVTMDRNDLVDSINFKRSVFDRYKRRGILRWLSKQVEKVTDFLKGIDEDGIPENERIIGLYPKERELKIQARFFSLMSYTIRMYVTITEELLSKLILPYFPMITMSDNLLQMITRLYNMTAPIGESSRSVTYCMNIDFSKWNQNMRKETNEGIFSNLDKCLGFKRLINYTHDLFRSCYLYLCSGEYIPKVDGGKLTTLSPYSRENDGSGKEGLRQKGWTITSVCDILSLAFRHKVKIELIGGGDNQVLTVTIPIIKKDGLTDTEKTAIKRRMRAFRDDLGQKMKKRGLPLKIEETWISPNLLMYNKMMYYNKVPLTSTIKAASRCFAFSNEGVMTIGNIMSTLGTSYQAISAKDTDPLSGYLFSRISLFMNLLLLFFANPISKLIPLDKAVKLVPDSIEEHLNNCSIHDKILQIRSSGTKTVHTNASIGFVTLYVASLYFHKIFGGISIGTPYSLMMKGFPDPLSECLAFNYDIIKKLSDPWLKKIVENLTSINASKKKNWEHLIEDPVSVNHDVPSHGLSELRKIAESALRKANIDNKFFKELLSVGDNNNLKDMANALCSANVLEPRILHDIVGATIPGYVNTITAKVDKSTTINKISWNSGTIVNTYLTEILYLKFLEKKAKIKIGHDFGCPTEDAQDLRDSTWGKHITGVTVPHPSAYLVPMVHHSNSALCDGNYISVFKKFVKFDPLVRGPFRPYFGSYTAEKFKHGELASAFGEEDILKRAIRIQKLIHWRYSPSSTMGRIIKGILKCVTDVDSKKLEPEIGDITGDVQHRYHDMATKHGGIPSNLFTKYSYLTSSTSTFVEHAKGSKNENIHFQASIIYCCMMSALDRRSALEDRMYHYHEKCKRCISEIEVPIDYQTQPKEDIEMISVPDNPLLFLNEEDVPIHFHSAKKIAREISKISCPLASIHSYKSGLTSSCIELSKLIVLGSPVKSSSIKLFIEKRTDQELSVFFKTLVIGMWLDSGVKEPPNTTRVISAIMIPYLRKVEDMMRWIPPSSHEYGDLSGFSSPEDEDIMTALLQGFNGAVSLSSREFYPNLAGSKWELSFMIHLTYQNSTILSCSFCREIAEAYCKQKTFMTTCQVHGEMKFPTSALNHSLDKIIKETARFSHEVLNRKRRLRRTVESRRGLNLDLKNMTIPLIRVNVTLPRDPVTAYSNILYDAYALHFDDKLIYSDGSQSYMKYHVLWSYILQCHMEYIILEIPSSHEELQMCMRALANSCLFKMNIVLYTTDDINLEEFKLEYLHEQKMYWEQECPLIKLIIKGDMVLDLTEILKENEDYIVCATSMKKNYLLNKERYLLVADLSCLGTIADEFERSGAGKITAVMPSFRLTNNSPILFDVEGCMSGDFNYSSNIDPRVLLESILNVSQIRFSEIDNIMDSIKLQEWSTPFSSMLSEMNLSLPIMSENNLELVTSKIVSNAYVYQLLSKRSDYSWYSNSLVDLLICIYTMTHDDPQVASRYYSRCSHYKLLNKKRAIRLYFGDKTGVRGSKAMSRMYDVQSNIYITYKGSRLMHTFI
ncbi:RNA-dependent RNA polymerase [alfalfa-associated nucleorhabdovirus]|uniref:RNA-directed RNA polymerase n=1 Tax=alfalfa-associated nucleorhabdovirus TaxID=2518374 RepID=A0A451G5G8_9RHAB|nr:RNA-dependent RNA polymerase [alfalfa-associated nucleorhabdovirus]QAB45076.1 RNA-dependent RNA polymerase [alfalfa-associated nucleorhabdovirus]UBX89820.1 RNA-dependent RNA polymerase [alfalfa-associated nucleorhabdovirus]